MNKSYKIVFNKARGKMVAVNEILNFPEKLHSSAMRPAGRS